MNRKKAFDFELSPLFSNFSAVDDLPEYSPVRIKKATLINTRATGY